MKNDPHPVSYDVAYASASELLERLEHSHTTSLTIVEALLARIGALDDEGVALHAIAAIADDARTVARERDEQRARGEILGPLHGLPVVIKDNIEAKGLPGLAGSTSLRGRPARDAALVTVLRDAGAIILASTNLSQWANIRSPHSTSGYSASGGLVANPWALDRSAGGSSSGSGAALAAGFSPLAVGTETDGSITCPASLNGVVGLKPTVGVTSRDGVVPISHSQDSPGPMARDVADLALLYGAMVGETPPSLLEVSMIEARVWRTGHVATDALFEVVMSQLRREGLAIAQGEGGLPSGVEYDDELTVMLCELVDDMNVYLAGRLGEGVKSLADVVAYEDENSQLEQRYFGHEFLVQAIGTGGCNTEAYQLARERNEGWARELALGKILADNNVVVSPAYGPAWKSDLVNGDNAKYVSASIMAAAVAGWPILTLPMGFVEGLPVGLTLAGRPHSEWTLLEAARQVEVVLRRHSDVSTPTWRAANRG
ncbi:MAG: amidase [Acidimicrobiaceae bacterium]|nr:amidase [Acidimicrobiaceae bacterium]